MAEHIGDDWRIGESLIEWFTFDCTDSVTTNAPAAYAESLPQHDPSANANGLSEIALRSPGASSLNITERSRLTAGSARIHGHTDRLTTAHIALEHARRLAGQIATTGAGLARQSQTTGTFGQRPGEPIKRTMHLKIIVSGKVVDTIVSEFADPNCGYLFDTLNSQSIGDRRSGRSARRQDLVKRPFENNLIVDGKLMQTSTGEFEDPLLTYLLDELGWADPF